jgi:uncharacterized membrane protein YukC
MNKANLTKKFIALLLILVLLVLIYLVSLLFRNDEIDNNKVKVPESYVSENADVYTNAIKNADIEMCAEVTNLSMRKSCIKIAQGKIDFINNQKSTEATSTGSTNDNIE